MSLTDLVAEGRLRRHRTSRQEIANLFRLADQGLADARVEAVSDARVEAVSLDRRFCAAYDAARSLATVVLACAGYRTAGTGQHATVFEALPLVLGATYAELTAYFDACRSKRNVAEYQRAGEIMSQEVAELIDATEAFRDEVLTWLREQHSELAP